jgi:hypothetical protein
MRLGLRMASAVVVASVAACGRSEGDGGATQPAAGSGAGAQAGHGGNGAGAQAGQAGSGAGGAGGGDSGGSDSGGASGAEAGKDGSAGCNGVPGEFADLYPMLESKLDALEAQLAGNPHQGDPTFAAELLTANGNRGKQLLEQSALVGVGYEIKALAGLGVEGVTISVGFPLLYQPFHDATGTKRDGFVAFFKGVVTQARSQGLAVAIETGPMFTGPYSSQSGFVPTPADYYKSLTLAEYKQGRQATATAIALELQPDFVQFGAEPDSEAAVTQQDVGKTSDYLQMISSIVAAITKAKPAGVKLGAGAGSWSPDAQSLVSGYCGIPDLDFVDVHLFPVNGAVFDRTRSLLGQAEACGKGRAIMETWMLKARDSELGDPGAAATDASLFSRDTYSFWAPLDQKFLRAMATLARVHGVSYLSPFWSTYFYAQLDYCQTTCGDPPGACAPQQLLSMAYGKAVPNIVNKTYTETGKAYGQIASQ